MSLIGVLREKYFSDNVRISQFQDILELRKYQSFEYKRLGNHIFVDGQLNKKDTRFMIDTGAGSSVLDVNWAKDTGCQVGPMDQVVYGIGGKAQPPSLKYQV